MSSSPEILPLRNRSIAISWDFKGYHNESMSSSPEILSITKRAHEDLMALQRLEDHVNVVLAGDLFNKKITPENRNGTSKPQALDSCRALRKLSPSKK